MDQQEFEATLVGVATAQLNARLEAVAAGQDAPRIRLDGEDAEAVLVCGARPFLQSGLDINAEALEGLVNGSIHSLIHDIELHGGNLNPATLHASMEALFLTGVLHERERAKREAAQS